MRFLVSEVPLEVKRDWYSIAEQPAPAPHLARPEGRAALTHMAQMNLRWKPHNLGSFISAAFLCTGGLDVIRKEAWFFHRTSSGVCPCWELEEAHMAQVDIRVDIRLSGKGNSNSHGAGPVY